MKNSSLNIAVTSIPSDEESNRLLQHDLSITKAAILYADGVSLCSPYVASVGSFYALGTQEMEPTARVEWMLKTFRELAANHGLSMGIDVSGWNKAQRLFRTSPILLTKRQKAEKDRIVRDLLPSWDDLAEHYIRTAMENGFDEIRMAAEAGVLTLYPLSGDLEGDMGSEFITALRMILADGSLHPMVDQATSSMIAQAIREGLLSVNDRAKSRGKRTGLVASLFEGLPVLNLPMDELLDVRKELEQPLVAFRAKVLELSNSIETAVWDEEFESDVQDVYQRSVAPALLEIQRSVDALRLTPFWLGRLTDKTGLAQAAATTATSAYLGAAVSPTASFLAAIASAAVFSLAGKGERRKQLRELEGNGLYFYYRLLER